MRPNRFLPLLFILVATFCSGCLDVSEIFTINPDGSGKVTLDAEMNLPSITMGATDDHEIQSRLREYAGEIIDGSEGVDAWKDVECTKLASGHIRFRGTAYFPSLSALKIARMSFGTFDTERAGDSMTVAIIADAEPGLDGTEPGSAAEEGSEDHSSQIPEPGDTLAEESPGSEPMALDSAASRQMVEMAQKMFGEQLKNLHLRMTLNLPGTIRRATTFTTDTGNSVRFDFPDKHARSIIDSMLADATFWRNAGKQKSSPYEQELKSAVTGVNQPRVTVTGSIKPLFDYEKEVQAAQKNYPELLKKFKGWKRKHEGDDGEYSMLPPLRGFGARENGSCGATGTIVRAAL